MNLCWPAAPQFSCSFVPGYRTFGRYVRGTDFYRLDAISVTQPTVSKQWTELGAPIKTSPPASSFITDPLLSSRRKAFYSQNSHTVQYVILILWPWSIEHQVKVQHPICHKTDHSGNALPSQSLGYYWGMSWCVCVWLRVQIQRY